MENRLIPEQYIPGRPNLFPHPFFSVIIITYNRAYLLTRALDSLVSQTEKDWEAIIVDDGSTDETYSRILPYLNLDSEIIYLRIPHNGISFARNTGLSVGNRQVYHLPGF